MMERDLIHLFETAKKAADTANAKGILSGQTEASCCIDVLSKLRSFPITRRVLQASHIEERLKHLTEHKNQKIRFTASALLLKWRQRIRLQENQNLVNAKRKPTKPTTRDMCLKQPHRIASARVGKKEPVPLEVSGDMESYSSKGRDRSEIVGKAVPKNKMDLLELFQVAQKEAEAAAEGSSPPAASRCAEALKQVEGIPWSLVHDAVFKTQVGNWVHSLIHHSNPEIRSAADSLFYSWLRVLYSGSEKNSTSSENRSPKKKVESKSMNKKIGGVKGNKSRKDRIISVLKRLKMSHRH